jgi:type IV pilus assembly protein PilB
MTGVYLLYLTNRKISLPMKLAPDVLKKIFVDSGYVEASAFDEAAKSAHDLGKKLEDVLIFRGLISPDSFSKLVSEYLKVPYVDLAHQVIPDEVLALVPEKMAQTYHIIPFSVADEKLNLAMEDPNDVEAIEFVKRHTGMAIVPHYASNDDIKRTMGQYKRNIRAEFENVIKENAQMAGQEEDLLKAAEKLPIIKMFDTILEYAIAERASDVHIEAQEENVIVRYRIDGVLNDIIKLPRGIEESLVARVKILSNLKLDERRIPQDGRYKFKLGLEAVSLRISIIPGFYGENVVMRILRESERPLSLEELGVSGHNLQIIETAITRPHGMILVTGPTGSGKTTTLYSILNILNTIKVKICTIEDPIEYGMARITQIQVNTKTGLTFATGLRSLLRHDPDIMMVGEIRDKETAEIAIHSALTGHLVLSTLHTNDAAGAVPRLLDMGIEGFLAASTINAVVAQRLVRRICKKCIVEYRPEPAILEKLSNDLKVDLTQQKFYQGQGCDECHGSGFRGRVGIYEVLEVSDEIKALISKRVSGDQILAQAKAEGMVLMMQDGLNKVSSGMTTIQEVFRAVLES